MDVNERWEEIEEAIQAEEAEGDVEDGHEEVYGGSETQTADEMDELTAPQPEGHGGGGEGESEATEGTYVESGNGTGATPDEVEARESLDRIEDHDVVELDPAHTPEIVHGRDDRVRVGNTRPYPWRTIAHLEITTRTGGRGTCSGAFIGPRVVLTAGHCLYLHGSGGWARSIRVIPGRNGSAEPYGSAVGTRYISTKGWVNDRNSNYDYGVIILPSNKKLGNTVGWMGLANLSFFSLLGLNVNNSGYPGDKPYGTQWWNSNRILALTGRRLYYRIDTFGGQSGSPVWRYKDGKRHIVGIHTTGASSFNGASRINDEVFKNLVKWKGL